VVRRHVFRGIQPAVSFRRIDRSLTLFLSTVWWVKGACRSIISGLV
jgi:hypothetical protein